jgi:hypothetical protein
MNFVSSSAPNLLYLVATTESKFLVNKFEFGVNLSLSLEEDCHEAKVTSNLESLVTFGMSLERVCHELYT